MSTSIEKDWSVAKTVSGTVNNIWGKLYTWDQALGISEITNKNVIDDINKDFLIDPSEQSDMGACPAGWHVPSHIEWQKLELFFAPTCNVNLSSDRCDADKIGWKENYLGTKDNNIIQALKIPLAGVRGPTGSYHFTERGNTGRFWASSYNTAYSDVKGDMRLFRYSEYGVYYSSNSSTSGFSVRCVKD